MNPRNEARQPSLPLYPAPQSLELAQLPREQYLRRATKEFNESVSTGPEGLFATVRSELASKHFRIPETRLERTFNQQVGFIIASGNQKKIDSILEHIDPLAFRIERVPEAEELHTKEPLQDAMSKAMDAEDYIANRAADERRTVRTMQRIIFANDQVNAIPIVQNNPTGNSEIVFEKLGKPENEAVTDPTEYVRQTFATLSQTAKEHNWTSVPYLIQLATVLYNPNDPDLRHVAYSLQKSAVFLSTNGLSHLATDRFDEYVARVGEQTQKANGKTGVTSIAGGLELQVLHDMGLVDFISGTPDEIQTTGFPPIQREDAKEHAYRLALGSADEDLIKKYFAQTVS